MQFQRMQIAVTCLALTVAASAAAKGEQGKNGDVVQKVDHGEINWSKNMITATGSAAANLKDGPVPVARLNAERAATLDAYRRILETFKGIRIDGDRNVADLMSNGTIRSKVSGVIRGAQRVDTRYYSDGSVDVVMQMPLDEKLTSALNIKPKKAKKVSTSGAKTFSGLVINAKGLSAEPSIAPQIVDEKGKAVYSAAVVSDDGLREGGIAMYESDVAQAKDETLVGKSPLVVKALRLKKGSKTDLVISNADADKLRDSSIDMSFLKQGKVVIVMD